VLNGLDVGGRATDLEQIAMSLLVELNTMYPKGIPQHIQNRLILLAKKLQVAEVELKEFANAIIREVEGG
jgi:hypothetical protein